MIDDSLPAASGVMHITALQCIGWRGGGMWMTDNVTAVTGLEHGDSVSRSALTPVLMHSGVVLWYCWAKPTGRHATQPA